MYDTEIISAVQRFDSLYNKKHVDYKNKVNRENAWKSVAILVGGDVTPQQVEARWTVLRTRFAAERRKQKNIPSGSAAVPIWGLYYQLEFLSENVTERRTTGNTKRLCVESISESIASPVDAEHEVILCSQRDESIQGNDDHQFVYDDLEFQQISSPSTGQELMASPPSGSQRTQLTYQQTKRDETGKLRGNPFKKDGLLAKTIQQSFSQLDNYLKNSSNIEPVVEDEDDNFGKSVACTLKKIQNRQNKNNAKIEIWQVLAKYDTDE